VHAERALVSISDSIPSQQQPVSSRYEPKPPSSLTPEMTEGILDATHFYVKYGVSNQMMKHLAADDTLSVVSKWQKMMEIYLTTQLHVVSGLGYDANEEGLNQYAQHLATCLQALEDDTLRELIAEVRRDTWRILVATCFEIDASKIPSLNIVDARNLMHKV
jgi:hypothetical protein